MKERPVLFNGDMVRAVLDGRKTQTRRAIKPQPTLSERTGFNWKGYAYGIGSNHKDTVRNFANCFKTCPFGQVGDRLWVRETWGVVSHAFDENEQIIDWVPDRPATVIHEMPFGNGYYSGHAIYAADGEFTWGDDDGHGEKSCWKPSIHMPRWASRITLEITNVGVQRLNSISQNDAAREGLHKLPASGRYCITPGAQYFGGASHDAREVFSWLWQSIYGEESWQANPWVWVIEFKRVEGDHGK
jgi:hypothetical protein